MPIDIRCSGCSSRYRVPDSTAGKRVACKKCGGAISVPSGADEPDVEVVREPPKRRAKSPQQKKRKPAGGGGGGQRPRQKPKSRPPQQRRKREAVIEDFDEIDDYDDPYRSMDDYDYDDVGPGRRGRPAPRPASGRAKWAGVALLILAIAVCLRTASYSCELIVKLMALTGEGSFIKNIETVSNLLKVDAWLQFIALLGIIAACVFMVMGPDRSGSQLWGIAALVLALIVTVFFFLVRIMPMLETGLTMQKTLQNLANFIKFNIDIRGRSFSLWNAVFARLVLLTLYLAPMFFALLYVRTYFKDADTKKSDLPKESNIGLMIMAAHAGFLIMSAMVAVLLVEVIVPGAIEASKEAAKAARNGGDPYDPSDFVPSKLWGHLIEGCEWIAALAFLALLIMQLRIYFTAWSRASRVKA